MTKIYTREGLLQQNKSGRIEKATNMAIFPWPNLDPHSLKEPRHPYRLVHRALPHRALPHRVCSAIREAWFRSQQLSPHSLHRTRHDYISRCCLNKLTSGGSPGTTLPFCGTFALRTKGTSRTSGSFYTVERPTMNELGSLVSGI